MAILDFDSWSSHAQEHAHRASLYADAYVQRRSLGQSAPVHDFLFTYYSFSPLKLKQWVPSLGQKLFFPRDALEAYPWLNSQWFHIEKDILSLNRELLSPSFHRQASFIVQLCENIARQPPRYGCFGLHEWAMVYKLSHGQQRHSSHGLRMPAQELAHFVASQKLCCTHYDAYRFFTPEARPLNVFNPQFETRLQLEQSGCVHTNMDIYKWATKLWPWIGSDFIMRTFMLALEARELDMRASPYDLSAFGYQPICIETEEGRRQYQREQQRLTEKATPLRSELHAFASSLLGFYS